MGLFDVNIRKELKTQKNIDEVQTLIKENISEYSNELAKVEGNSISLDGFKSSILKYNITATLQKSNQGFTLVLDGEIQQFYVLILFVLIIVGILFTFGIAIIFIVAFAYLQKQSTKKFIDSLLDKLTL